MSSKTKIIVLKMKEIIYTALFIGFAIVLIMLFLFMFRPKKDNISGSTAEQTAETAGQGQAPAAVPEQNQQGQAAETAGQGQTPAPDLFGAGQTTQGKTPVQGQTSPQGQKQPRAGQKSPRPEVATPTPKAQRKTGQHV